MNVTKVISKNVSLKSAENDFIFYRLSSTFCQAGKLEITGIVYRLFTTNMKHDMHCVPGGQK